MKISTRIRIVIGIVTCAVQIACNDPKTASKENFKAALNKSFQTSPLIVSKIFLKLPVVETDPSFKLTKDYVNLFSTVGFLEARDTVVEFDSVFGLSDHGIPLSNKARKTTKVWALSEKGKANFHTEMNPMVGKVGGFKWADVAVKEMLSFTEPADMMGKKVSEATYTIEILNQAPWVDKIKGQKEYAVDFSILKSVDKPRKSVLVLTSEGWVDGRSAN